MPSGRPEEAPGVGASDDGKMLWFMLGFCTCFVACSTWGGMVGVSARAGAFPEMSAAAAAEARMVAFAVDTYTRTSIERLCCARDL